MKGINDIKVVARSMTLGIFILLLLVGCGSSPPVRYFTLSPVELTKEQDPEDSLMLGLGPIRLPEYLNRSQLVTRGNGAELEIDEFSRWAEPLTRSIHRVVSTDVDNMMTGVTVLAFPWDAAVRRQVDFRLIGEVTRFDADQSGRVILQMQWAITEEGVGPVVLPHRRKYESRIENSRDPAMVAAAMNEALALFSRDVVHELETMLQK
jgi:uncharacterized lipoprotein YmbA